MAGNTIIRGLGSNNQVQIERWGHRKNVQLDDVTMARLRDVLYKQLPTTPPHSKDVSPVSYEFSSGHIALRMNPREAQILLEVFQTDNQKNMGEWPYGWVKGLERALEEHRRHISVEGEPGIDPSADEEYDKRQT